MKKKKGVWFLNFLRYLGIIIGAVVFSILIMIGIQFLQQKIFVPNSYLLFQFKAPYSYFFLFFEIELIVYLLNHFFKSRYRKEAFPLETSVFHFMQKHKIVFALLNLIIFYMCLTNITVITEEKMIDYSFYNPRGTVYQFSDIEKIETGFKGSTLKFFKRHQGDFYYTISFDNKKVDLYQSVSEYEDTYYELELLDEILMDKGIPKDSSTDNIQYNDLAKRYVNRFERIIKNKN